MKNDILSYLSAECPWRDTLYWYDTTDSTNLRAKELAREGAPEGTIVLAGGQTGGRGRLGRSFSSPAGQGVYLSAILRPNCPPEQMMHLTCAVGVAMCAAVERACGVQTQIKWINDLVYEKRKLGGILVELAVDHRTGLVDYAIVGVGINCLQSLEDFPEGLRQVATSLRMAGGENVNPALLAARMTEELWKLSMVLESEKQKLMAQYKQCCITLGKDIAVIRRQQQCWGKALDLDGDGGLVVRYDDGTVETVSSGEVSVRGMYGYV